MKSFIATTLLVLFSISLSFSQAPGYTANDTIAIYEGHFRPGTNMGYFPPWDDEELADLAAGNPAEGVDGVGARSVRPSLPEHFLENWGYDYRVETYQHYYNLDLQDLTTIVGFPADWHRDPNFYCSSAQSEMFDNLYDDIWDNGENGTPVNDENYLALYVYKLVENYGDYITFWEIWNEPGFDYTGARGWLPPGAPGNWWENNPEPCDYKLRAPIFHYIRTLRVCYEVIKSQDPDGQVSVAGLGFPAFLDAILRNTDNPVDGSVTAEYPNGGGAYFDVMGFHSYPNIDGSLREWNNDIFDFIYYRHSDAAADGMIDRRNNFQSVLDNYGYDGGTYPKKQYIITETNVPRRSFGSKSFGDDEVQVNWVIKALVTAHRNDYHQMHMFNLAETTDYATAQDEFDLLGLYEKIAGDEPYQATKNQEAFAYKTTADLLYKAEYDQDQTDALQLPTGTRGAAFLNQDNNYVYVLWAQTLIDSSEVASATYTFPAGMNITNLDKREWDFSETSQVTTIGSAGIELTGTPIFLTDNSTPVVPPTPSFTADVTSGCNPVMVNFTSTSTANSTNYLWTFPGGTPSMATVANPIITYDEPGTYPVTLEVSNSAGANSITESSYIDIQASPDTDFYVSVNGLDAFFTNNTDFADSYFWDFGDGTTSTEENPSHTYATDADYIVTLTATNSCGSVSDDDEVEISTGNLTAPTANFSASTATGCAPFTASFNNLSSPNATSWNWSFSGGNPANSTAENPPTVTYLTPGTYTVILVATNAAGNNTQVETDYIVVNEQPTAAFTTNVAGSLVSFSNTSANADAYMWNFGDGTSSMETFPNHTYLTDGSYTVTLTTTNDCGTATTTQNVVIVTPPTASFMADATSGCAPFTVNYSDLSSANTTSWSWTFPGGTPSTSTAANPVVEYSASGTYSVILTASNAAGVNTTSETNYIVVTDVPTANFGSSISGNNISLFNTSSGANTYLWDFGDGNTSTNVNPNHTYVNDGSYMVQLTATNDCGAVTTTQTVVITTTPSAAFSADATVGCAPLTVSYNDQSSANATSWNWDFPGGSPATSTDQNPVVTYTTSGNYNVTLTASNSAGTDISTQTNYISILEVPVADFSLTANAGVVSFQNASSGATDYSWDFGDSNMSLDENPTHTYTSDGTYTVILTASNDCGTVTSTETVTVVTATPSAAFTANNLEGCAPLTVTFSDQSSGNATSWNWDFPGGTPATSTDQNPVVTYTTSGSYNVTLTAGNPAGTGVSTQSNYINILDMPAAGFNFNATGPDFSFFNTSTNATSYSWDFGDSNTSLDENPTHTYLTDGTYTVVLTASNDCGTITSTQTVTVSTAPVASFTADTTFGCAPMMITFMDQSSSNSSSWNWTFPGGTPATSTDQNPVVTYSAGGVYNVMLEVTGAGGSDVSTQFSYINISQAPQASFTINISGSTFTFVNSTTGATMYSWDFGDGNSSTETNPQHTYATDGTYIVELVATNSCGTSTSTETIVVSVPPTVGFSTDVSEGCLPLTVNYTDESGLDVTSWSWTFPGGTPSTSTEENPVVVYDAPGTYNATLVVTNPAGSSTLTQNSLITVNDVPNAGFTFDQSNNTIGFTNTSTGATSYLWDFGDGSTSTTNNTQLQHFYPAIGDYTVVLIAMNACGSDTTEQTVSVLVSSLDELGTFDEITIFPNPNDGHFTLQINGIAKAELQVGILNVLGQTLTNEMLDFSNGSLNKTFDISYLTAGTYMLRIGSGTNVIYRKVVIN